MKKILALAVGMLLIPFTAFGMEAMSDGDMDSITGQSGVAISLDNIQLYTNDGGTELWYETSLGTDGDGDSAAVGLVYGESPSYLFINKIQLPGVLALHGDGFDDSREFNAMLRGNYTPLGDGTFEDLGDLGARFWPSVLSIRVAQHHEDGIFGLAGSGAAADFVDAYAPMTNGAYIEIGLPTLEIYAAEGSYDEMQIFVLGAAEYEGTSGTPIGAHIGDDKAHFSLGTIYTTDSGSTTAILGGRVGITSLGQLPQFATSSGLDNDMAESNPWDAVAQE